MWVCKLLVVFDLFGLRCGHRYVGAFAVDFLCCWIFCFGW